MTKLHLDFETASTADLRKIGAAAYAAHPDTRILCMAWAFDQDPVTVWTPWGILPLAVTEHILKGGVVSGWNLQFEYHIWNSVFIIPKLKPEQLDDTQARAAYHGLPFSLEDAGFVLRLPIQKDKAGHALMLRMSRPRALDPVTWWHEGDPARYQELQAYCARDVDSERAIDNKLDPLPDRERAIWLKDFTANVHGVTVDKALAKKLHRLAGEARKVFDARINILTSGKVPAVSNTAKLLAYINSRYPLANLQKDTVKDILTKPVMVTEVREVLELRQAAAKTSAAKLPVLLDAAPDGIIRGMLAYYGAQRTGRWAGRLLQPQNLPRGVLKDKAVQQALDVIDAGARPDDLELLFGKPGVSSLDVIAALIRSCLVARPGKRLVVADFSQIEARVIAWLAGQGDVLNIFETGRDVYLHAARAVGSDNRQLGKVLVLACGFGQGPVKFKETAKGYGLDLTKDQCENAVHGWRKANHKIVTLWDEYGRAARMMVQNGAAFATYHTCKVDFSRRKSMMVVKLPSGRELFYHNIRMVAGELTYDGVSQTTKRWEGIRTYGGKIAENVTQAVARDVMAEAILTLSEQMDLLLTIHDELICEADIALAPACLDDMLAGMRITPPWAVGLPVGAAGWTGERYRKA